MNIYLLLLRLMDVVLAASGRGASWIRVDASDSLVGLINGRRLLCRWWDASLLGELVCAASDGLQIRNRLSFRYIYPAAFVSVFQRALSAN